MKKIFNFKDTFTLNLPKEVLSQIRKIIKILESEYGSERKSNDLGGYILIIEKEEDLEMLKEFYININKIIPEYIDIIDCNNGEAWLNVLILLNSDFAVTLIMRIEIAPSNLIYSLK